LVSTIRPTNGVWSTFGAMLQITAGWNGVVTGIAGGRRHCRFRSSTPSARSGSAVPSMRPVLALTVMPAGAIGRVHDSVSPTSGSVASAS
jgi:hypothetical protein